MMCQLCRSGARAALVVLALACSNTGPGVSPRELEVISGDRQETRRGDDASEPLRVRVIGSNGEPLPGAIVQWAVTQGQATLNPTQGSTSSTGEAETRVTNVATIGMVIVQASAQGPAADAASLTGTFSIIALDPCLVSSVPPYQLGTPVTGVLRTLDCLYSGGNGRFVDFFAFGLTAQQVVSLRVRSNDFAPMVALWTGSDRHLRAAVSDDRPGEEALTKAILPPGAYIVGATSSNPGATGSYELLVSATSASVQCELVLVVRGIATVQQLASTDCARTGAAPSDKFYEDRFWIALYPGERVILTQSSAHFRPRLQIQRASGALLSEVEGDAGGTARINFTADSTHPYRIIASSSLPQQTGEYTLAVSHAPGASLAAAPVPGRVAPQQIDAYTLTVGLDVAATPRVANAANDRLPPISTAGRARPAPQSGWARLSSSPR
jgi:hypothetical protein